LINNGLSEYEQMCGSSMIEKYLIFNRPPSFTNLIINILNSFKSQIEL
jgi:hypothetical protein